MTSSALRGALAALTALLLAVSVAGAADPKPVPGSCKFYKAASGDAANQEGDQVDAADITGAWVNLDAAKGAVGYLQIKNLTGKVDPPNTSITYDFTYGTDQSRFVRAYLDYTGSVAYEYGHLDESLPLKRYIYDGTSKGAMYPGENGIVEIVFPPEAGGKAGTTLKGLTGETQIGAATPGPAAAPQAPSRGISFSSNTVGMGNWLVGPCGGSTTTPSGAGTTPDPGVQTGGGGTTTQQTQGFPGTLATKSVKAAKKGKTIKVKVKSNQPLTKLVARLSKGKSELGRGKLAKLNGKGTFKIKLKKALKKGTYVLSVTGTDAQGHPRPASFKLKVK